MFRLKINNSIFKNLFLKIRRYLFSFSSEVFLFLLIFILGFFLVFLGNFEIKRISLLKPSPGGIYREGLYENIEPLNPIFPKNDSQKAILNIIYPPLIEFDNGQLISKFLKEYNISSDGLTYTLTLKDDLFWSNGDPLTADDVFFGFQALKKEGPQEIISFFKNIEAGIVDPKKIVFKLKTPDNYFLSNLKYLRPLPQKIFSRLSFSEFSLDNLKIGSGPFVLEEWIKGDSISFLILKRNSFFKPQPYLEKVVFYIYPSAKRAFDGLLLKEIDGLAGLNYFNLPSNIILNYRIHSLTLPRVIGIFFNSRKITPEEVNFLEKEVNRDFLVKEIFNGYAEESKTLFSPKVRSILKLPKEPNLDIKNTKKPEKILLTTHSFYFYPEIARYFRDRFGFQIEFVSPETFNEKIKNKDYQAVLTGLNFSHQPAPFYFFSLSGLNLNNIENIGLEKQFEELIANPQINWSQQFYEIEKKILANRYNLFLLNPYYLYILSKNIYGFDQNYLFDSSARFVKIEYWFKR